MPEYELITEKGETLTLEMSRDAYIEAIDEQGWLTLPDGRRAKQRPVSSPGLGKTRRPGCWPMESDALGCHPAQIPEFREWYRKRGISIDYTPDGCAILRSPGHRRACARARGLHDNNGGYSDP